MKTLWTRIGLTLAALTLLAAGAAPTEAASRRYTQIAAGGTHACAITEQGRAYCWGANDSGQLGNGDSTHTSSSTAVSVAGRYQFTSIAASISTTCAITAAGKAYCWGANTEEGGGILGNGDIAQINSDVPVPVTGGHRFDTISAGTGFFCGLARQSKVYCWGNNRDGQLGDGTREASASPVAIDSTLRFNNVSAANWHACALSSANDVYCWGNGVRSPTKKESDGRIVRLESVETDDCGLTRLGELLCLNGNVFRRVVGAPKYADLAVGSGEVYSLCGIGRNGSVACWSFGRSGEPARLESTLKFSSVAQGGTYAGDDQFSCGLTTIGVAYCWGQNRRGQLGNGTESQSTSPVRVQ